MNSALKQYYQEEWESTPNLTLDELASKYAFDIEDLGDISDWRKHDEITIVPEVITSKQAVTDTKVDNIRKNITQYKQDVMKECVARLKLAHTLDTKELKELTTVVDIVDKSLRSTAEGQNINVLIQNIVNKYGDDC